MTIFSKKIWGPWPQWRNKGGHLPPGAALRGRQTEVGLLRTNCKISDVNGC